VPFGSPNLPARQAGRQKLQQVEWFLWLWKYLNVILILLALVNKRHDFFVKIYLLLLDDSGESKVEYKT
jgi:hypothetical protein